MDQFEVGQTVECVAIPIGHEGHFTIGNEYEIAQVDQSDCVLPIEVWCNSPFPLWCNGDAFVVKPRGQS